MNFLPYVSWWFYGAANPVQQKNYHCSWGLLKDTATEIKAVTFGFITNAIVWFLERFL